MLRSLRHQYRAVAVTLCVIAGPAEAGQSLSVAGVSSLSADQDQRQQLMQQLATERAGAAPTFFSAVVKGDALNHLPTDVPVLRVVFPQAVFFDTDQSAIRPEATPLLDAVADALRKDRPNLAVFVVGHTDSRGSDAHNYALSVARADAVASALQRVGTGTARLWRIGFGQTLPIAANDSPETMARNRRVEFVMASDPQAVAVWLAKQVAATCAAAGQTGKDCRATVASSAPFEAVDLDRGGKPDIAISDDKVTMAVEPGPPVTIDLGHGAEGAKAADPKP